MARRQLARDSAQQALGLWRDFPVHREPRPIVLTAFTPAELDRLAREAPWRRPLQGSAVPESTLPAELRRSAIDYCHDVQTGAERPLAPIFRRDAPFATDRGRRELPAWVMYPDDRRWPWIELDPEFRREHAWWPEGLRLSLGETATLGSDGRTLTYRFIGTPSSYADYPETHVVESETAVLVHPVEVDLDGGTGVRLAYMEEREVVVRLDARLGNRVLTWGAGGPGSDTFGSPVTVLPAE
jgi:hypothetical protein